MEKDYESSEFYACRFHGFSTVIIIPATVLVLAILIASIFIKHENTVSSVGAIEPQAIVRIENMNYHEGQVIRKGKKVWLARRKSDKLKLDGIVHIADGQQFVEVFPVFRDNASMEVVTYVPGNKISAIKNKQKANFSFSDSQGKIVSLKGKVKQIGVYPKLVHGQSMYQVLADVKVRSADNLRYGMQGNVMIRTGEMTYFEYLKNLILNQ